MKTVSNIYNKDTSNSGNCYNRLYQNKQVIFFSCPKRKAKFSAIKINLTWYLVFGFVLYPIFGSVKKKKATTNKKTPQHNTKTYTQNKPQQRCF